MIIWPSTERPVEFPFSLFDWQIINAGKPPLHQSMRIEFPVFVTIRSEPLAGIIMPLIGEANGDAVIAPCPQLFHKAVFEFFVPFPHQELPHLGTPFGKLSPVSP
jgi:hypothetical protein